MRYVFQDLKIAVALVVGGLAATPATHAAITATSITTPSNHTYFIGDNADPSQNFTVTGTATGATSGDAVDINCYFNTSDLTSPATVAHNVPVTTLKPRASKGSEFTGFSGACKGKTCKITATANVTVKAMFALKPCVVPNVVGKSLGAAKKRSRRRSAPWARR